MGVEVDGGAGGGEGLVAAAAVVDTKVLEYTDGGGLVEGDVTNGWCGGQELCGAVGFGWWVSVEVMLAPLDRT